MKSVWQRLQALADEYPEIELEIVGGEGGHMGETLEQRAARAEPRRAIAIVRKAARRRLAAEEEAQRQQSDSGATPDSYDPSAVEHLRDLNPRQRPAGFIVDEPPPNQVDYVARDGSTWRLHRDPGETDEEFEMRRQLFTNGRLSVRVEEAAILRDPGPEVPLAEVISDPTIMSGDPTINGTRILAETILAYIRAGHPPADIHEDFPTLPPDGIGAVLRWDAQRQIDSDEEELVAFGSGNVARDLGIPQPEATAFKWRLARILALAMEDRNLDAAAVAELAGEIEPAQIDRITKGLVRNVDTFEILRLLKALGYRIVVDVLPPKAGVDGVVWVNEPDGYRYDEKAIEVLKGVKPRRRK